ncbi:MAG TPA: DUF4383 domain-containing protein [Candidatus Limnocylindrales bacterium]|jgi:hypothetical protein
MRNGLVMQWAAVVGVVLVVVGLLGFVNNPIVGKDPNALVSTNEVHNIVHLLTGLLALYVAFGLKGAQQATGLIAFGALYAVIFIAVVISPDLFGLFGGYTSGINEHIIHAAVAVISLGIGWMSRGSAAYA